MLNTTYPDRRARDRDYRRDDDRRPDTRHDRDREREREQDRRPDERRRADDTRDSRKDEKDGFKHDDRHASGQDSKNGSGPSKVAAGSSSQLGRQQSDRTIQSLNTLLDQSKQISSRSPHPNVDPGTPKTLNEDGEAMEEDNDDDAAMMAMMGVTGFGSTKVMQRRTYSSKLLCLQCISRANRFRAIKRAAQMSRKPEHGVNI